MATVSALPLFHLYGDPPDDQAFDFIHVETISSRSSAHDWLIRAHRHRNLFQILLIERGGGEMTFEAANLDFNAPAAILAERKARTSLLAGYLGAVATAGSTAGQFYHRKPRYRRSSRRPSSRSKAKPSKARSPPSRSCRPSCSCAICA